MIHLALRTLHIKKFLSSNVKGTRLIFSICRFLCRNVGNGMLSAEWSPNDPFLWMLLSNWRFNIPGRCRTLQSSRQKTGQCRTGGNLLFYFQLIRQPLQMILWAVQWNWERIIINKNKKLFYCFDQQISWRQIFSCIELQRFTVSDVFR